MMHQERGAAGAAEPFVSRADLQVGGVRIDRQPADGLGSVHHAQRADVAAISQAARDVGALSVMDTSQAIGWLPVDPNAADLQVCAAYKWLCSPRGTAFLVHHPALAERHPLIPSRLRPLAAGWFAGEVPHESYYGPPLRLARDARRFDISPAWHCWVGAAPALQVLA